jgi:hypothetical protein
MIVVIFMNDLPTDEEHWGWFDATSEITENFARLIRYMLAFDPQDIHYEGKFSYDDY